MYLSKKIIIIFQLGAFPGNGHSQVPFLADKEEVIILS